MKLKLSGVVKVVWRRIGGACRADDVSGEMMSPQPYVHNFMHAHLTCCVLGFAVVR